MNINPFDILKNAQKIQEQMGSIQEKFKEIKENGSSGGGMVEIELNGNMDMIAIKISADAVEGGDLEMLQDLIIAAYNSAVGNIKDRISREMGALAGMNFPQGYSS